MESSSQNQALAVLLPKLMGLARLAESLANRFKTAVLVGGVTGVLAALWLGYFTVQIWQFSLTAAGITGAILVLPALIAGWCWMVLDDATGMPRRIVDWVSNAHVYVGEAKQRFQAAEKPPEKGRFKDLWQLGGLLYELNSMGADARDLYAILKGSLALSNPLFISALIGSGLAIAVVDFVAFICGLFYLFR